MERRYIDRQGVVDLLNQDWIGAVVTRYNSEFAIRYFGRPPTEPIPTEPRLLTTFRTRLGGLLEYGLGVTFDEMLGDEYGPDLRLAFVVAHEYPDYFFRGHEGQVLARLDCKLLHDESAEYSARFVHPYDDLDEASDLLLYGAWQWRLTVLDGVELVYPHVDEALVVPAIEIALERDRRLALGDGYVDEDGKPWLAGGGTDTNYGKIDRIVHHSRRNSPDLTENVKAFLSFTDRHADAVALATQPPGRDVELTADEASPLVET